MVFIAANFIEDEKALGQQCVSFGLCPQESPADVVDGEDALGTVMTMKY